MTKKLMFTLQLLVALVVTLISFSAKAVTDFEKQMCADEVHERCVSNAYNRFLEVHRDYKKWDHDLAACKFRFNHWQAKWQEYLNKWNQRCEGKSLQIDCRNPEKPEMAESAASLGCENALNRMATARVDDMLAELARVQREAEARRASKKRQEAITQLAVLGPNDVPKPAARPEQKEKPKVPLSDKEAADVVARVNTYAAATNEALATEPPPVSSANQPAPPKAKPYDFQVERYNQWRAAHPGAVASSKPNQRVASQVGNDKVKINCIPEHVSVVKISDNGDLTLFIHAGADVTALQRCLPNHDFDPVKVVNGNIAAATIPYYFEYADRPMNRNKLNFHKGRWHLKRSEWKISGKEFFADFFQENMGKEFGFALQGGQRLKLSASVQPTKPTNAEPEVGPNEPAKHGKYKQVQPEEKQLRFAGTRFVNLPASESEPAVAEMPIELATRSEAQLPKASSQNGSNNSDVVQSITPIGQVMLIRAGPRVARVMYIRQKRYRQKGGADLNFKEKNFVRYQAQERLPFREHYGQNAFG